MSNDFETRAREVFEDSLDRLDGRTRSRLTQARHAALDELKRGHARARWLWAPAGGLAAAALVAVVLLGRPSLQSENGAPPLDELEAAAGENIELLQDVEFYAWLAEQSETPDANRG